MSDAQLFQFANTAALLSWVVLIVQPKRMAPLLRFAMPVLMAMLYIWALATAPANPDGGFGSLAQVKALFSQDRAVLAGWVHYLAFDLFVGCWEVMDAQQRGVRYLLVIPCLLFTFMFGPVGLLLYLMLRATLSRNTLNGPAAMA
jgi:hypothetical protein